MQPNKGKAAKRPLTDELSVRRVQSALVRYRDESLQKLLFCPEELPDDLKKVGYHYHIDR